MPMYIIYSANGEAIPDHLAKERVLQMEDIHTSSEIVILAARALIATGKIDCNDIEFFHGDESIGKCNKYGKLQYYPDNFCDMSDKLIEEILGL